MNFIQKNLQPIIYLIITAVILLFALSHSPASSSTKNSQIVSLLVNPSTTTINTNVTANIILDTKGNDVNAVGIVIHYDPKVLNLKNVDTSSSFCTLYTDRQIAIIKGIGVINLFCGKPNPGFNGENVLESITFTAIDYGNTAISIDPTSMVLENNGKATNILTNFEKKQISVILSN